MLFHFFREARNSDFSLKLKITDYAFQENLKHCIQMELELWPVTSGLRFLRPRIG